MTDTTELAQREKFEAWFVNDVVGADVTFPAFEDGEYAEGEIYDEQLYFMLQAMWMAWKAASADLVEALEKSDSRLHEVAVACATAEQALEKAQQRIGELEQKHCGGALMERELAHSEVINKLMSEIDNRDSRIAELDAELEREREKSRRVMSRIAELEESNVQVIQSRDHYKRMTEEGLKRLAESRTVKLPDDEDGQAYGFGKWASGKLPATAGTMTIAYCEDAWRAAFEVFSTTAGIKLEWE